MVRNRQTPVHRLPAAVLHTVQSIERAHRAISGLRAGVAVSAHRRTRSGLAERKSPAEAGPPV